MQRNLGEFEILVLAALIQLGPEAYGISIKQAIEERTDRSVSIGALYSTLNRLEKKAYIIPRLGDATAKRGGRAKKHFDITALGRSRFEHSVDVLKKMLSDIPAWNFQPYA